MGVVLYHFQGFREWKPENTVLLANDFTLKWSSSLLLPVANEKKTNESMLLGES